MSQPPASGRAIFLGKTFYIDAVPSANADNDSALQKDAEIRSTILTRGGKISASPTSPKVDYIILTHKQSVSTLINFIKSGDEVMLRAGWVEECTRRGRLIGAIENWGGHRVFASASKRATRISIAQTSNGPVRRNEVLARNAAATLVSTQSRTDTSFFAPQLVHTITRQQGSAPVVSQAAVTRSVTVPRTVTRSVSTMRPARQITTTSVRSTPYPSSSRGPSDAVRRMTARVNIQTSTSTEPPSAYLRSNRAPTRRTPHQIRQDKRRKPPADRDTMTWQICFLAKHMAARPHDGTFEECFKKAYVASGMVGMSYRFWQTLFYHKRAKVEARMDQIRRWRAERA
nr:uncharacterized protein CI109_003825 [Kwoniella shandongensis]KAA5527853.1 hypothetical protein CI109_003825 [Kwoniella shandongensis]